MDFVFKVLAKFGYNKHNEDIQKNCGNKCFFPSKGGGGGGGQNLDGKFHNC